MRNQAGRLNNIRFLSENVNETTKVEKSKYAYIFKNYSKHCIQNMCIYILLYTTIISTILKRYLLSEQYNFTHVQNDKVLFLSFIIALNKVTLLGRAGADPQKRGTMENPVVIFSLATHTNYKYDAGLYINLNFKK